MKFKMYKSRDIEIPKDEPFKNYKLKRGALCSTLTNIVSFYGQSGCVMALSGEWGSGKTTFVKMWKQQLDNDGYKTIYFNAWTSDYTEDPLLAMILELSILSSDKGTISKLLDAGGRISFSVINSLIIKHTGINAKELKDIITEKFINGKKYIKEYAEQKVILEEFKTNIRKYIADNTDKEHPVVFFVDELDRCNPHYAVRVLERIKHLFDIPNIIFILAINKIELENAIQGFYGSANINASEYLRRFIDIEYALPEPMIEDYCDFLYHEYKFDDFFLNSQEKERVHDYEGETFLETSKYIFEASKTNLRLMDRIYAYTRLALKQFSHQTYFTADTFFLLSFWKVMDVSFYNNIR